MKVINPRTGSSDYELREDDPIAVARMAKAVREANSEWASLNVKDRAAVLANWLEHLKEQKDALIEQLSIDTGRIKIARIEIEGVFGLISGWIYRAPQLIMESGERPSVTASSVQIRQRWVPYELVGVISPWNFPLLLALIDTIPALMAGASVLLKPSEVTPRFMDPLQTSIEAVPELAAVFKLIRGGAEAGKAVVQEADAICFTGSVPTGKLIAKACAERLIPAFLELGGKDPAIVLEDADLDLSTDAILRSCVGATGQACQSLERIYVAAPILDEFVSKLVEKAKAVELTTNIGLGQLGPIIYRDQALKIQSQLEEAVAAGAKLHCGGKVEEIGGALWCRPTVLTNVDHSMKIMQEETFGPVIPIMPFSSEEEALQLANDSIYGLSGSVFSQNQDQALAVAAQMEVGAVSINDASLTNKVYDAEKHAFKQSGLNGSRMGAAGILRFFRKQALLIQTARPATMADFEENQER